MSIFNWFKPKIKTNFELQAELSALVKRIVVDQAYSSYLLDRYEALLVEVLKRGLKPADELILKKDET